MRAVIDQRYLHQRLKPARFHRHQRPKLLHGIFVQRDGRFRPRGAYIAWSTAVARIRTERKLGDKQHLAANIVGKVSNLRVFDDADEVPLKKLKCVNEVYRLNR